MYYIEDKIINKLKITESELLFWRSINHIYYSEKTDKYDLDSVLECRTMTLGLEKVLDEDGKTNLLDYAQKQSSFGRYLFQRLIKGDKLLTGNEADKIGQKQFGLKSYMGLSIYQFIKGKVKSAETWYIKTIENLENKIIHIEKDLEKIISENKQNKFHKKFIKGKKKKLHFLKNKLAKYQSKTYLPTWFGRKYKNDKDMYRKSRTEFTITGEEAHYGNRYIRLQRNKKSGEYELKVFGKTYPIQIPKSHQKTFSLDSFNRQSIRVGYNKNGKLVLNVTYYYIKPVPKNLTNKTKGVVGIDIGPKEIAVCFVKNDGNPSKYKHYPIGNLLDKRTEDTKRFLSEILDDIVTQARHLGFYTITIENLKFKPDHSFKSKKLNRMLSKFPREIFQQLLSSKCIRNGLKLKLINPAYTSVIGLFKYSYRDNLSTAHNSKSKDLSAALTIGRRGLEFNDKAIVSIRLFGKLISIPLKSILSLAEHDDSKFEWESKDTKSNWSLWSKLKKLGYRTPDELTAHLLENPQTLVALSEISGSRCNSLNRALIKIGASKHLSLDL